MLNLYQVTHHKNTSNLIREMITSFTKVMEKVNAKETITRFKQNQFVEIYYILIILHHDKRI
jgi:hypothetical protein